MDSEKHPDFFFSTFWWELGGGMGWVGTDGDSPEGKTALCTPAAFPGQPGSKLLVTPRCVAVNACCGYRQSRFGLHRERMGF